MGFLLLNGISAYGIGPGPNELLTGFFETYLRLNKSEEKKLEIEMEKMDEKEVMKMIELTTSWEEKGRIEGRHEGKIEGTIEGQTEILLKQLRKRFSEIPVDMEIRIKKIPGDKLEQLAEAIFDLKTIDDVKAFL